MSIESYDLANLPTLNYEETKKQIKTGDILLCSGSSLFSKLIQGATKSQWSHVGFLIQVEQIERIMVMESVESIGVRTISLRNYFTDYNGSGKSYPGDILIARHQQFTEVNIDFFANEAIDFLGYPYDTEAILRIAGRLGMKAFGFSPHSEAIKPHREFICSEYVYACFKAAGIAIPYDPLGFIAPCDFARCKDIAPIARLQL